MDKCKQWLISDMSWRNVGQLNYTKVCLTWQEKLEGKSVLAVCQSAWETERNCKGSEQASYHLMCERDHDICVPLSAIETELLKYCSSSVQSVSFDLLVTPQKPWQFTLISDYEIKT